MTEFTEVGFDGLKVPETADPQAWAKEFMRRIEAGIVPDEGWMIGWFSNAIEAVKSAVLRKEAFAAALESIPVPELDMVVESQDIEPVVRVGNAATETAYANAVPVSIHRVVAPLMPRRDQQHLRESWEMLYGSQPLYSRWVHFAEWVVERYNLTDEVLNAFLEGNPFFSGWVADGCEGTTPAHPWVKYARSVLFRLSEPDAIELLSVVWNDLLTAMVMFQPAKTIDGCISETKEAI